MNDIWQIKTCASPSNHSCGFSLLSQIPYDDTWEPNVLIQMLAVSVKLERLHGYLQGAFAGPRERRAALCSTGSDSDIEKSLLLIIHFVNLSPPISLSHIHFPPRCAFALTMTRLDYSSSLQLSALTYRPILKQEFLGSALSLLKHAVLTPFHFYLAVTSPRPPQFLPGSYLPPFLSLSLSKNVRSHKNQFL